MTVIKMSDFYSEPEWAEQHMEFAVQCSQRIRAHLHSLTEKQLWAEYRRINVLFVIDPLCPGRRMANEAYLRVLDERGLTFSREAANESEVF